MFDPAQKRCWIEDSDARSGKLDCQGQPVKTPTDLRDRLRIRLGDYEVRLHRPGPLHEQLDRIVWCEWRHNKFALARYSQRRPTGDDQMQSRTRAEQLGNFSRRPQNLLEVVKDEQQVALPQVALQSVERWSLADEGKPKRLGNVGTTNFASVTGARRTTYTPSSNRSATASATCSAARVFPVPPAPVSVKRRHSVGCIIMTRSISPTSFSRPMNVVRGAGRLVLGRGSISTTGLRLCRWGSVKW